MKNEADFRFEIARILQLKGDETLSDETKFDGLDSMAVAEICVAAEELLDVEIEFGEARRFKTYQDLVNFISQETGEKADL